MLGPLGTHLPKNEPEPFLAPHTKRTQNAPCAKAPELKLQSSWRKIEETLSEALGQGTPSKHDTERAGTEGKDIGLRPRNKSFGAAATEEVRDGHGTGGNTSQPQSR